MAGDEAVLFAQISDLHIGILGGDAAQEAIHRGRLARALAQVEADAAGLALLLVSGDLADHGAEDEYRFLLDLLARGSAPALLLPGNHDDCDVLAGVRGGAPGFDTTVDLGPIRLIGLDSLHPGHPSGRLDPSQLAWLEDRLDEDDRPTVVALHHPPLALGSPLMDAMALEEPDTLGDVLVRHPQVERIVCGHVHRSVFARWRGIDVAVAPSLAYQLAPDLDGRRGLRPSTEPPAYALHRWHPVDGLSTHIVSVAVDAVASTDRSPR